jgi:hypothetical protein
MIRRRKKYLCLNPMQVKNKCENCNNVEILKDDYQHKNRTKICSCGGKMKLYLE